MTQIKISKVKSITIRFQNNRHTENITSQTLVFLLNKNSDNKTQALIANKITLKIQKSNKEKANKMCWKNHLEKKTNTTTQTSKATIDVISKLIISDIKREGKESA